MNQNKIITLVNNVGHLKRCKIGFSWTNLIFMYLVPLCRLDFKNFFIQLTALIISAAISQYLLLILCLVFAFNYNKMYILSLLKRGYLPFDENSKLLLNTYNFKYTLPTTIEDVDFVNSDITQNTLDLNKDSSLNSFTNLSDYKFEYDDINIEEDYSSDKISIDDLSLEDLGFKLTMTLNGKDIIDNDIEVNDIAPEGYNKFLSYEKVVGVTFDDREVLVNKFINGINRKITLIKDTLNEYDPYAIKVFGSCLYDDKLEEGQLGFLDKNVARKLSNYNDIKATVNAIALPNKIRLDIWISLSEYKYIKELQERFEKIDKNSDTLFDHIDKGREYEKDKNIDKAIELYEKAIQLDFDGNYPYDRLAILYRKNKDYDNEIRVLNKGIEVFEFLGKISPRQDIFPKLDKFKERLSKAEILKEKHLSKVK